MEYIELSISITPFSEDNADMIVAEIDELGYESYLYEEPLLKAYIKKDLFNEQRLKTILSGFRSLDFSTSYSLNLIKEENWNAVWESSFEPVVIDGKCTIKATYHKGLPRTKYNITINPKMAFGTGHHQTTCLMIESLLSEDIKGKQVLDMGCGTGILSILSAKMKAKILVHSIDVDPIAVNSTKENAYKNRVSDKIEALCGDASLIQAGKYDLILANINRNIILEDLSTYTRGLKHEGMIILSGFYEDDLPMIRNEASVQGLKFINFISKDKWVAAKFAK